MLLSCLGRRRFPAALSGPELEAWFTLGRDDRHALRHAFNTGGRIGAAVQLGFLRMASAPLATDAPVPAAVLQHLASQLGVPTPAASTLRQLYLRPGTLYRHRAWAITRAGLREPTNADIDRLTRALLDGVATSVDLHALARTLREALASHGCLVPGDATVRGLVRDVIRALEHQDRERMLALVPQRDRDGWLAALLQPLHGSGMTRLEWLRTPPLRRSPAAFIDEAAKLATLADLAPRGTDNAIPVERLRAYARRMQRRPPHKVGMLTEPQRSLELGALLAVMHTTQCDVTLQLLEMRIADIWRWAHTAGSRPAPDRSPRPPESLLGELERLLDNPAMDDAACRTAARALLARHRAPPHSTRAALVRDRLVADRRRIRPLLQAVVALRLGGDAGDPTLRALHALRDLYTHDDLAPDCALVAPGGRTWQPLIDSPDRATALRAFEADTLRCLRRGLRNGSLWRPEAKRYGGRHRLLLPFDTWAATREGFLIRRRLPATAAPYLDATLSHLQERLARVDAAIMRGDLTVGGHGHITLPADPDPGQARLAAEPLRSFLYARAGRTQLPELLVTVDCATHFSHRLLGHAPRDTGALIALYGALLAAAMALDATDIALMLPDVPLSAIRRAGKRLEDERALRAANDAVVALLLGQPLSHHWGQGREASSDMMSMDVSRRVWLARADPRRRRHAVGSYTHVLDRWAILYDQPLLLATRQAGAALEGALRQSTTRLDRLAVDTHGYTDVAMAVAKLLGLDLCPRLYGLADRQLHVPSSLAVPASLSALTVPDVSLDAIHQHWDGLLHLAATIDHGWRSATDVLERYGRAARHDPVHRAANALGQLQRTAYLCDYLTTPGFRRNIGRLLDHGEAVHALKRRLCTQPLPYRRSRRIEELAAASGALTLLTNCVMAWNTVQLQRVLDHARLPAPLARTLELLRHVGPVRHRHINFRGTYRFPVRQHADQLLDRDLMPLPGAAQQQER